MEDLSYSHSYSTLTEIHRRPQIEEQKDTFNTLAVMPSKRLLPSQALKQAACNYRRPCRRMLRSVIMKWLQLKPNALVLDSLQKPGNISLNPTGSHGARAGAALKGVTLPYQRQALVTRMRTLGHIRCISGVTTPGLRLQTSRPT